jgi:hypothetical protein
MGIDVLQDVVLLHSGGLITHLITGQRRITDDKIDFLRFSIPAVRRSDRGSARSKRRS